MCLTGPNVPGQRSSEAAKQRSRDSNMKRRSHGVESASCACEGEGHPVRPDSCSTCAEKFRQSRCARSWISLSACDEEEARVGTGSSSDTRRVLPRAAKDDAAAKATATKLSPAGKRDAAKKAKPSFAEAHDYEDVLRMYWVRAALCRYSASRYVIVSMEHEIYRDEVFVNFVDENPLLFTTEGGAPALYAGHPEPVQGVDASLGTLTSVEGLEWRLCAPSPPASRMLCVCLCRSHVLLSRRVAHVCLYAL